jgi:hypothetical protein
MNLQEAIAFLDTLLRLPNAAQTKSIIIQIAQAAGLPAEGFLPGDPSERWLEIAARAMVDWGWSPQEAVRCVFFPLATDPGDANDFGEPDVSLDQTPRPGFLSAIGASFWGTTRREQTTATAFVTIQNTGSTATTPFTAGALTFSASAESRDDGGTPTYVSTTYPSVYVGIGATLTLAAGATATIPVIAQQPGEYGSASVYSGPGTGIDTVVTQSYGTLVVTAATKATGTEREARTDYIERCKLVGDGKAPGGPRRAYLRAMNTRSDGDPLLRFDGSGPVTIISSSSYVSADSATGEVTIYYAGPDGAVDTTDASSANANIIGLTILDPVTGDDHNPNPMGVLPDCVGLLPLTNDPNITPANTPGGQSATNDPLVVHYSVKLPRARLPGATTGTYGTPRLASTAYAVGQKYQNGTKLYVVTTAGTTSSGSGPTGTGTGITDGTAVVDYVSAAPAHTTATLGVLTAIASAVGTYLPGLGIGGQDQVAGAGVVYTVGITVSIGGAYSGLYDPIVTLPATTSTAVALGHVAVAADGGANGIITGTMVIA